jgi:hypothetical protein
MAGPELFAITEFDCTVKQGCNDHGYNEFMVITISRNNELVYLYLFGR